MSSIEQRGIPSVFIIYEDQDECFEQAATLNGIPHLRRVLCSRTIPGPEDVDRWIDDLLDALVRPLTPEETAGGVWEEPDEYGAYGEVYCDGCDMLLGGIEDPIFDFGFQFCSHCRPEHCAPRRRKEVEEEWLPAGLEMRDNWLRDWENDVDCQDSEGGWCGNCWWVDFCWIPGSDAYVDYYDGVEAEDPEAIPDDLLDEWLPEKTAEEENYDDIPF